MSSRSRWSAVVGFSPTGWNGARKMPKPMRSRAFIAGLSRLPRYLDASRSFSLPGARGLVSNAADAEGMARPDRALAARRARGCMSRAADRPGCPEPVRAPVRRDERQRRARQRRAHRGLLALRRVDGLQVAGPELLQPARLSDRQRDNFFVATAPAHYEGGRPTWLLWPMGFFPPGDRWPSRMPSS